MSQPIINQQFNDINNKQENNYQYRFTNPKNTPISKQNKKNKSTERTGKIFPNYKEKE